MKQIDVLQEVRDNIEGWNTDQYRADILLEQETRQGFHFITHSFDSRILNDIPDVSINKDGLLYLECIGFED